MQILIRVAPYTGAWIETVLLPSGRRGCESLPIRGRGLKPGLDQQNVYQTRRSLYGGVD